MLVFGIDIPVADVFFIFSILIGIVIVEVVILIILLARQWHKAKRLYRPAV